MSNEPSAGGSAFRVDKFVVPADALPEFMERVHRIQGTLDTLPGCLQNLVLKQTGGPAEFNVVTVVEWASARAMDAAKATVQKKYAEEGFDPASFMQRLGVRADMGLYGSG